MLPQGALRDAFMLHIALLREVVNVSNQDSLAGQTHVCPSCGKVLPAPSATSSVRHWLLWPIVAITCACILSTGLYFGLRFCYHPLQPVSAQAQQAVGPQQERIQALIRELRSDNRNMRDSAIKQLGEIGVMAVPTLIEAFRGAEPAVSNSIATAIAQVGPPAIPFLRKVLATADTIQPSDGQMPSMIMSAVTKEDEVRMWAVLTLQQIGTPAIPTIMEMLGSNDSGVRSSARDSIVRMGDAAVPALIAALGSDYPQVRRQAAGAMADMARGLGIYDPQERDTARHSLEASVPSLIKALRDRDMEVSQNAAEALGTIGASADAAVPALTKVLTSTNALDETIREHLGIDGLREAAARSLGKFGPAAAQAVPALTDLLKDKNQAIQGASAESLGCIGPAAKAAIPAMKSILADPMKYSIRDTVAESIKKIEGTQ